MQNIEEMYEKYSKIIYKYIFCLTKNHELSEEILQDTFLVAVKNIDKFEEKAKLTTWLCAIAKNIYYKRLNKDKKITNISVEDINTELADESFIEDSICEKESKLELIKQIQELEGETKNVMYLRIYAELSYEEIGEVMGKTDTWARVIFFRGKEKLKENMKKGDK